MNAESSRESACPSRASRSRDAATRSSSSRIRSFRLLEPALTTRTRTMLLESGRPGPFADARDVLAVLPRVRTSGDPAVDHELPDVRGSRSESGNAVDHVHDQMKAVQVVPHHYVERR